MTPLHVCAITFDPYPYEPRALREAEAAAQAGHRVDVIAMRQPLEARRDVYHGVQIYRLPMSRSINTSLPLTILRWCWFLFLAATKITRLHLRDRYDVVHVHNMPDFLVFAALVPKLLGAKIILDVQDVSPELMAAKAGDKALLRGIVIRLATWQERVSIAFADHVLTTGDPFAQILMKRGVPPVKITSTLNSADPQLFPPERRCPPPYDASPGESTPFIFMYHGTLAKRNGLDMAIRALAIGRRSVSCLRLDIQGRGEQLSYLKELATALDLSDAVSFRDFSPIDKIVDFVVHGDVGIIPYEVDGFEDYVLPTKAYEYAWMGRPMIASDTYAIRSMFRTESIYLCDPSSPESFADAMIDLYRHPEKRARMVANAAEDYYPYRWESMAKRYQDLLLTLCDRPDRKEASKEDFLEGDEAEKPIAKSMA